MIDSPKNKKRVKKNTKKHKKRIYNDSDNSDNSDDEFNPLEDIIDKNSSLNAKQIQKMISKMFPTKSKKEKKRQLKNIQNLIDKRKTSKESQESDSDDTNQDGDDEDEDEDGDDDSDDEDDDDDDDDDDDEDDDEYDPEEDDILMYIGANGEPLNQDDEDFEGDEAFQDLIKQNMKFNIIFTTGPEGEEFFVNNSDSEIDDGEEYDYESSENEKSKSKSKSKSKKSKTSKSKKSKTKTKTSKSKTKDEDGYVLEYKYDDDTKKTTRKKKKKKDKKKKKKVNKIIQEDDDNESDNESEEDEDDKKNKPDSKYKKGDIIEVKKKGWDKFYKGKIHKINFKKNENNKTNITYDIELDSDPNEDDEYEIVKNVKSNRIKGLDKETLEFNELIKEMKDLVKTKKKGKEAFNQKISKMVEANQKLISKKKKNAEKKGKQKNLTKFKKLLREKSIMNDYKYFTGLPVSQQKLVLKKMEEINEYTNVEKPYRLQLIESEIPVNYKANAMKKINTLNYMDPGSGEYYKIKQWVDTFMRIPFNKHNSLPISITDGPEKCQEFMENAKKTLDEAVYGMEDAKMQILQMVGQWISNPNSLGTAIAVKGPPGTGKTTLIKEGVSKILNRPFAFLALGGATDSSFLEGHSYTYEGSVWGRIVDILLNCKCMNPVIYFDELDKISDTPKGEEIVGILTHLTDTTQNDKFHDKYFSNIDFNLSKAMFIFSYNDENKVNPILKDRMYRIKTDGYKNKQKCVIANDYLIPSIQKNVNFEKDQIIIPNETITYICDNLTDKEKGVRNLKRCLEIIYTKLNLYRLMKEGSTLFDKQETLKVEFPFTVTKDIVDKLIKKSDDNQAPFGMYL